MSTTFLFARQTNLPNRFVPPVPPSQKDAWKQMVGKKQVPARLSLLPTGNSRWGAMSASLFTQLMIAAFLVATPMLFPEQLVPKMLYEVIPVTTPETEVPLPPKPPVAKQRVEPLPPVEQPLEQPKIAKLVAPRLEAPRPKPARAIDTAAVNVAFAPAVDPVAAPDNQPARPREPVKTGSLSTGSAAPATLHNVPVDKVQTGGFGDPNGVPSHGAPITRGVNINAFGSPALPSGPGYGNGTGGANGVRGTVASTGFGNGTANPPPAGGGAHHGTVQSGGFANESVTQADTPKPKRAEAEADVQPVVILAKPNPVYTDEARKLGLEGEVLLDVVFPASGPLRVNRVIHGLGHGLDQAAIRAAEQIQFKPAISEGRPVDFPATVHIVFQIAN
ncbi:MAG: energy transducer TonB [Candidatus Acidiferrales bacterium]